MNTEMKGLKSMITKLTRIVSIAYVSEDEIKMALTLPWSDFEDSVQYSVSLLQKMDGIVTRNPTDYKEAEIMIWKPEDLLSKITIPE
ncbi:MAG: hypothetical protein NC307_11605 [Roseburia sp.]|nr:hypothetical protein [Roseburia sp.]